VGALTFGALRAVPAKRSGDALDRIYPLAAGTSWVFTQRTNGAPTGLRKVAVQILPPLQTKLQVTDLRYPHFEPFGLREDAGIARVDLVLDLYVETDISSGGER
jgi:hypothetical protein